MSSFEETTDSSTQSALYSALGVTVIYHPLRKKTQKNTSKKINGSIKYEKKKSDKKEGIIYAYCSSVYPRSLRSSFSLGDTKGHKVVERFHSSELVTWTIH